MIDQVLFLLFLFMIIYCFYFVIAESDLRQEKVLKDKTSIIQMKVTYIDVIIIIMLSFQDDEIAELKAKMDDMAEEFGEMLRVSFISYYYL